jgi:hypothetical protein
MRGEWNLSGAFMMAVYGSLNGLVAKSEAEVDSVLRSARWRRTARCSGHSWGDQDGGRTKRWSVYTNVLGGAVWYVQALFAYGLARQIVWVSWLLFTSRSSAVYVFNYLNWIDYNLTRRNYFANCR